jgi:hypothetical protein
MPVVALGTEPRGLPVGALDLLNRGNLVELVGDDRDGAPVTATAEVSQFVAGDWRQHAPDPSSPQKRESGNEPMPDRGHAISALRRAERQRELGNLAHDEFERIDRKARRKLRKRTTK